MLRSGVHSVLAAGLALSITWQPGKNQRSLFLSSFLLGAGIVTMHYTGMAAMHLDGFIRYEPRLFTLSIVAAIALSYIALRVKNVIKKANRKSEVLTALILGGAVSIMHYTAISATYFMRGDADIEKVFFTASMLAILVAVTTAILALASLALASISRNREITELLRDSHQQMNLLLNSMAEGAYGVDVNGSCTFVNQSFLQILGYKDADEIIGKHIHELIHHSHPDGSAYPSAECKMYNAYRRNEKIHVSDEVFWNKGGTAIPVEYWSQPLLVDGVMQGAIATFIDITERKQVLADLRESEERFRQMFARHSAVMLLIDPKSGIIVDANPSAAKFYGYPLENLRGKAISLINTQSDADIESEIQQAVKKERNYFVFEHRLASGDIRTVEVHSSPVSHKNKQLLFSIIHDITERKLAEAQIYNLAFHDELTQLPNRRLLNDRLGQAVAICKRTGHYGALMFLDLDNFKPLNDKHGHKLGDLLLVEAAHRISSCIRETDTAARFGGDEFVVILNELGSEATDATIQAKAVAEKIRIALSEPYFLTATVDDNSENVIEHHCTSSIGVVVFNRQRSAEDILKWADMTMYEAKNGGRNRVVINQLGDSKPVVIDQNITLLRLNWHESYNCGESTIDQEHRKLFELANTLIEASFARHENPQRFDTTLEELLIHVVRHFADEEEILMQHSYVDLEAHAHAHKKIIEHALQLRDKAVAGSVTVGELVSFLAEEVVAQHLLKTDRQFYSLFEKVSAT